MDIGMGGTRSGFVGYVPEHEASVFESPERWIYKEKDG
jgi:hypothetical protein